MLNEDINHAHCFGCCLTANSKFLRYQELEVELDEYRLEIEHLRALVSTSYSVHGRQHGVVVGKLKISAVPSSGTSTTNYESEARSVLMKKTPRATAQGPTRNSSISGNNNTRPDDLRAPKQGKVVLMTRPEATTTYQKESFVIKTRRRAQEAEYYKQVRLAQLEAECELEENIHIRTAREVKVRREAKKKQREQDNEAALIREKITMLQEQQQQQQVAEEEQAKQQEQKATAVVALNATAEAHPTQDERAEKQQAALEAKGISEGLVGSKSGPAEVSSTPVPSEEVERGIPPTNVHSEELREATGGDPGVKVSGELDVYESFSEDSKPSLQNQVIASQATADHIVEQVDELKPHEAERSTENDPDTENAEAQEDEVDAEIEELSINIPPLAEKQNTVVAEDPLEVSEVNEGEEDEKSYNKSAAAGASEKPEDLSSNATAEASKVESGPSDHLYDEENFDDDHNVDDSKETMEQPRQGFLVDVVDPHTRLGIPEPRVDMEQHPSAPEHHHQGFLLDVVDPHSRIPIQEAQDLDEARQGAPMDSSEFQGPNSGEDSPLRTEISTETISSDPPTSDDTGSAVSSKATAETGSVGEEVTQALQVIPTGDVVPDVKQEQPVECLADSEADAIQVVQVAASSILLSGDSTHQQQDIKATECTLENQIASGVETVSQSSDLLSFVHLTAAELEDAMEAAARKIQQFWRQMDARFRRALNGEGDPSDAAETASAALNSSDIGQVTPVDEGIQVNEAAVVASDSKATSPSYTPYSTPRDVESDEPQSPLQESQEDEDAEQQEQDE